ncbi:hypothetical protein [Brevundimonas variabilis]|uniref:Uncharacterized protein n=1 Tax=Brevundimonas variabilis TaxID=74312 RepID=A0A7W9CGN3_9CAUL|nr:hypothetical protein [Brevundimonas variabilis]MBB5745234.1 hypothetical protein [Brevundimonas variabilis]
MKRKARRQSSQPRIDIRGFLLAAIFVSPISFWFFLVTGVGYALVQGESVPVNDLSVFLGMSLVLTVVVAGFGIVPACLFGAIGLWLFESLRKGRVFAPWIFAASGAGVAGVYVGVALAGRQMARATGFMFSTAPWADFALASQERSLAGGRTLLWIIGCILAAGVVAGLIYDRSVRRPPAAGKRAEIPANDERG